MASTPLFERGNGSSILPWGKLFPIELDIVLQGVIPEAFLAQVVRVLVFQTNGAGASPAGGKNIF